LYIPDTRGAENRREPKSGRRLKTIGWQAAEGKARGRR